MKLRIAPVVLLMMLGQAAIAQVAGDHWVGTWATAEVGRPQAPVLPPPNPLAQTPPAPPAPFVQFSNQTLRQIVHTSIGGTRLRIMLSNVYGTAPLTVGTARVALRDKESSIVPQSARGVMFSGRPAVTIPAGAIVVSDAVDLTVPALADLAIDLYVPGQTDRPSPLTMHAGALQANYVSGTGDHAGELSMEGATVSRSWFLVSRVEVMASAGAVVTFGDSITDGTRSTPDTNSRWPDQLARRLTAASSPVKLAVLNAGIAGNRLLSEGNYTAGINALARFEHQVLEQPGATHVIVLEGINDIGIAMHEPLPSAEDLIAAHRQMIERAHTRGMKIYGATLTPFEGAAYYTLEGEAKREALNQWIRTAKAYDAVIDFDLVTRDPNQPKRVKAEFDSGDHLHPNDAGYAAMANAIDLSLFQSTKK